MEIEYIKANEITIRRGPIKDTYWFGITLGGMWIVEPEFGRLNRHEEEIQSLLDNAVSKISKNMTDFETKEDLYKEFVKLMNK